MTGFHRLSIADLRNADPVAVTEFYLDRIDRHNGALNAFTALDRGGARAAAAESLVHRRHGIVRPLEGVPIGIKANIDVEGLATTVGIAHRRDDVATADAAVVARLRDAGAIILGHLNLDEAALGATTDNPAYGRTENPHRIGHTPGGSSGGSGAAVAAGLCAVALGTDTMGSVRIPAAYTGVYGLKPTHGLVDTDGLVPLAHRLDAIGVLARSVEDLAAAMAGLADLAPARMVLRVATLAAVDSAAMAPAVAAGYAAARAALSGLGLAVASLATPGLDLGAARRGGFIEAARAAAITFAADRAAGGISAALERSFAFGRDATPHAVASGEAAMALARAVVFEALDNADVLLLPTAPQAAFAHGRAPANQADFTALANFAGLPALSLPAGWDPDGLPVAVQLVGPLHSESTLLGLAARLDGVLAAYRWPRGFA